MKRKKDSEQIAVLCNGSTADSDSVCLGSNPGTAAKMALNIQGLYRGVAQLGRALRSGRRGRVFESRHSDSSRISVRICEQILGRGGRAGLEFI